MTQTLTRRTFCNSGLLLLTAAASGAPAENDTAGNFKTMPAQSRIILHWYVFGPAWESEEARRQLRLMHDAHVGGVLIFPTYPIAVDDAAQGIHNDEYLSPRFFRVLRAVTDEAKALGMTVDIVAGTGWPYGGPSVKPEDSAKMIRRSVIEAGPSGDVSLPVLEPGEERIAVIKDPRSGAAQVFTGTPTKMQVKRASVGAEGLCVDHLNAPALRRYLDAVASKLVEGVQRGGLRALFCDSLEVYRSSWTSGFAQIFKSRRGYDLAPYLPAFFDDAHPDSKDVRHDFWRTISEQGVEGFLKPLQEWTRSHGVLAMVEAYGSPPVNLTGYRYTDIPTGEHYEWKEFSSSRWASSGGRLAGKNVIMAEAWTWTGLPNRFADTLEQLKLCSDLHFLSGINALYGLTYAYSPVKMGAPGWPPYFGPVMNHTIPAWPHVSRLMDYVNRASYVLQQGKPVADVALYLGAEDSMAQAGAQQLMLNWATRDRMSSNGVPPEFGLRNAMHYEANVVKTIITQGYSFDGIDTFVFNDGLRVEAGRLRIGDGDYSILVLPNLAGIDIASLEKIKEFVTQGGTVIATRRLPDIAYGIRHREQNRSRVKTLTSEIFGPDSPGRGMTMHRVGKGKSIFCRDEKATLLAALRFQQPDILFTEASEHVSFVHRRTADVDYYFISNTSESPQELEGTFRVGHATPERWDLRTGDTSLQMVYEHTVEGTRVPLHLKALESIVLVFRKQSAAPRILETNLPNPEADGAGWKSRVHENGPYFLVMPAGRREIAVLDLPAPSVLAPEWTLRFDASEIAPLRLSHLRSWTELPTAKFFSGRGIYEAQVELPDSADLGCVLDLGAVRETAEVFCNGKPAGVAWMRPYQLDVTGLLRSGTNVLRIEVTNLLINKVLGMGPIDYSRVYARYGQRFPAGEEWEFVREPFPSGLMGPVRLLYYQTVRGV